MKRCPACGVTKPTTEFWTNATARDGFQSRCKQCFAESRDKWPSQAEAAYAQKRATAMLIKRHRVEYDALLVAKRLEWRRKKQDA